LADEHIDLLHIRNYHTPSLLQFMQNMGFQLLDSKKQKDSLDNTITQFLYKKNPKYV